MLAVVYNFGPNGRPSNLSEWGIPVGNNHGSSCGTTGPGEDNLLFLLLFLRFGDGGPTVGNSWHKQVDRRGPACKFRQSRTESRLDSCGVDIPLAGFIFDDGSSSCCCWASWEMAAVFLGLHDEQGSGETNAITRKRSRKGRKKQASSSLTTIAHLQRIMKRHGRVTVRNQASTFDSSCQDLVFSAKLSKIISCSDQDFFQSLILKACCNTLLTVVGSLMSSDTSRRLETHLTELGMVMLPMKNIWVSEVRHMDSLNQAKKILQGLVQS